MRTVTFQVLEGIDKGRVFRDLPIPVTIGREDGNILRLNDERVSRFHAKVQFDGGDVILTDLDSTNGTRVNGSPVQIRRLLPGDQVALGRSVLLFGSHLEITHRGNSLRRGEIGATVIPVDKTIGDPLAFSPELELSVPLDEPPRVEPPEWHPGESNLPPLPQKLTPAQSARIAEILDFLHRGLASASEHISANEDGSLVRMPFGEWQKVQAVEMLLARYFRAISEPDTMSD